VSKWNSLPDSLVEANTIICFKSHLDTIGFWINQAVLCDWEADFTGIRNSSYVFQIYIKSIDENMDEIGLGVSYFRWLYLCNVARVMNLI